LPQRPFNHVRKADEPERDRLRPKFLTLQRADLYVIEGRRKICGDLCRFLFGYGIGRILSTGFKHVLKCTALFGRASVPSQMTIGELKDELEDWPEGDEIIFGMRGTGILKI
jgi:hypothetical protein